MRNKLKILNEFGVRPTNNHLSAGADFYVPYIEEDKWEIASNAFLKSYGVDKYYVSNALSLVNDIFANEIKAELSKRNAYNIVMLFLSLNSASLESYGEDIEGKVRHFIKKYLTFDSNGIPGVILDLNDTLFVNSGIHVALFPGTAGIFLNKSGKGNAGFDVRAQVVDEDYTGFVHLSVAYTKDTENIYKRTVYCGDKLTQMVVLPVIHCEYEDISAEEYFNIMNGSNRGTDMCGSSDVKHC